MVTLNKWKFVYFSQSVFDCIAELPIKMRSKYFSAIDVMRMQGPNLGMPYTKAIGDGLFELRIKSNEGIVRIFYCLQVKREIVLLHCYIKKTEKAPKKELRIAKQRMKEVQKNA